MKKTLFFVVFWGLGMSFSFGQACAPDSQYTTAGVYPDSATGLSPSCVGVLYDELITIVVPADTTVVVGGISLPAAFDSAVVTSFLGLPPGFTYACHDAGNVVSPTDGCTYEGGTTGCMVISGTPTASDIGTHVLAITVDAYVGGAPTPALTQVVDYYTIVISGCTASLAEHLTSAFTLYPNPSTDAVTLEASSGATIEGLNVTSATGQVMFAESGLSTSRFELNTNAYESGLYFVTVDNGSTVEVIQFVKK